MSGRSGMCAALALVALLAGATGSAQAAGGKGTLEVRVTGLPGGERPKVVVRGKGVRRVVRRSRATLRLRPGRYRVVLRRVKLRRAREGIRKGSLAVPARGKVAGRVRGGKRTLLEARYDAIVSANASTLPGRGVRVASGVPGNPSQLVLPRGKRRYKVGGFLTSGPSSTLPGGLIARITSVDRGRRGVRVGVESVPVAAVVPVHTGGLRAASEGIVADAQPRATAAGRTIDGPDLAASDNLFAAAIGQAIADIPCRLDGAAADGPLSGPYARPKAAGPTFQAFEWSVLDPHVHISGSYQQTLEFSLPAGANLNCSESTGFAKVFPVPVGPLVLPVYVGARLEAAGTVGKTDADSRGEIGAKVTFDADTRRGDAQWLTWNAEPVVAPGANASAELRISAGAYLEVGVGAPDVVNMRFEAGPEAAVTVSTQDWTKTKCQLDGSLVSRLVAELFVKTYTLDLARQPIFGPQSLPFCSPVEPLVGDWKYADGGGTFRVQQTGPTSFTGTAVTDITADGDKDCPATPAGAVHKTFEGSMGEYVSQYAFYETDSASGRCALAETDPQAKVTITPTSRDRVRFCGKTATRSGCDTLERVVPPPSP